MKDCRGSQLECPCQAVVSAVPAFGKPGHRTAIASNTDGTFRTYEASEMLDAAQRIRARNVGNTDCEGYDVWGIEWGSRRRTETGKTGQTNEQARNQRQRGRHPPYWVFC